MEHSIKDGDPADILSGEIPDEEFELLDDSEKKSDFAAVESRTYFQDAWSRFKKNKLALASLIFLTVMVLLAVFGPMLSP